MSRRNSVVDVVQLVVIFVMFLGLYDFLFLLMLSIYATGRRGSYGHDT